MIRIIVLGANGMLGRYVTRYFDNIDEYNIVPITRNEYDFLNDTNLYSFFSKYTNAFTIIINCVGIINKRCNIPIEETIYINSIYPHKLAKVCQKLNFKLIHPSTDCVFSGSLDKRYKYLEDAITDATDIYGKTKSLGEPSNCTVLRTSIIGEEIENKRSLIEWLKKQKGTVNGYTNHYWNGITCLQFAKIVEHIIKHNQYWNGVRHVFSPEFVTKYELLHMIKDIFEFDIDIVRYEANYCNRMLDSIYKDDLHIPSLLQQLEELKRFKKFF